jgi:uncharacterized protein (DUF1499 family)
MAIFLSRWTMIALLVLTWVTGWPAPSEAATSPLTSSVASSIASLPRANPIGNPLAALFSFPDSRPVNLGLQSGQLAPCPQTANCVNSQAPDAAHQIAAIPGGADPAQALANVAKTVAAFPGAAVITTTENYVYAEFTSQLLGFVDDVEFYLDPAAGVIQTRSASRIGESDFGVNRRRIESIRLALQKPAS